jgi:hypothetical protein
MGDFTNQDLAQSANRHLGTFATRGASMRQAMKE